MSLSAVLGLPFDHFTHYPARVAAVTAADVQRVAREYFDVSTMVRVVVGQNEG